MRLRRGFAIAVLLWSAVFALLPGDSFAQSKGTLRGTLSDPTGAAVAGAEVSAQLQNSSAAAISGKSGTDGGYELMLAPGNYHVVVQYPSFIRAERDVTLSAGDTQEWNVSLRLEKMSSKVVVTDSAEPALQVNAPDPVDTITREMIEQRQQIWLVDLLSETVPGASFDREGPYGGVTGFFLDGGDSDYTKVLVDGTPINQPGGAIDFSNLTLNDVEKIEVVHGATSALYGSDAMDGTIQIFTHRGTTKTPEFTVEGDGGTFETGHAGGQLSGLLGAFDYSTSLDYFDTNGQGPDDYFRDTTLSGNFGWKFSDTDTLRLAIRNTSSDAGQPGQTLLPGEANYGQSTGNHDFSSNLAWNFSVGPHWQTQLSGFDSRFQSLEVTPPYGTFNTDYNRAGFIGQETYLFHNGTVTAGYENEMENGSGQTRHNQAGYVEFRYQFTRRLTAIVGGREEDNGFFGTRGVPRVGVSYALRDGNATMGATRLRASYGQGIKEPSILPSDCSPQLKPEQSTTVDAGIDQFFASDRFRLSATFFHNDFRDITSFASFGADENCPAYGGSYFNTDKARAYGVDSSFEAKVTRWLSIVGTYSYDDSRVLTAENYFDPALAPGNRLFHRPLHSANIVANANFRRMNWNLSGHYVGRQTDSDFDGFGISSDPSYIRWDLSNSVVIGHGLSTIARFENLFDKHYEEAVGYPALGYNYRVGIKYTWPGR